MSKLILTLAIVVLIVHSCMSCASNVQARIGEYAQPEWGHCDTDTDCMQKFGGDGSPRPLRLLRQEAHQ